MREAIASYWSLAFGSGSLIAADLLAQIPTPPIPPAWANYAGLLLLIYFLRDTLLSQRDESRKLAAAYESRLADARRIRDSHLARVEADHAECRQVHLQMLGLLKKDTGGEQ